jgi:O-antigen/teichoic acid export membrane protein
MMMGIIMTADKVMKLVAGGDFITSGRPLQILAIAVFGVYLGAIFGHTAVGINRQKETIWVYLSSAVITLIGYLIFIPKFGMYGAAWMTVFSEIYVGLMLFLTIRHYTGEKLTLKTLGKIILATLIMTVVLFFLKNYNLFIQIIAAIFTYGFMILATRAISSETIREIIPTKKHV